MLESHGHAPPGHGRSQTSTSPHNPKSNQPQAPTQHESCPSVGTTPVHWSECKRFIAGCHVVLFALPELAVWPTP